MLYGIETTSLILQSSEFKAYISFFEHCSIISELMYKGEGSKVKLVQGLVASHEVTHD